MKKKLSKLELALKKIAAALQAYVNDHIADIENPHGVTKTQIGLGNVTNDAQVKRSEMGVAEGVATLDTDGKIPSSQLPTGNGDAALLGDPDGTAFSAEFDPQTDTVWNKAQVLTSAQKAQVKENLGLLDIVFNTAYDPASNKAATMADIPQSLPADGGNALTVNNHSVQSDVPADAVFTDTTYSTATQSDAGLMSAADKNKLDNTKNITVSSSDPTSSDGEDGDIWFVYDAS